MTDSRFEVENRNDGGDRHVTPEEPTLVNASFILFS